MSQYNNKGMASDLSLGRPTASSSCGSDTSDIAAAAARHAYYLQLATRDQKELLFRDDAEYESNIISGLESYVRALQAEREKLDAFRRELPICMGLLDDAIHTSREKLTKAVASSRMVACQTSYSNYGNPVAEAANMSKAGSGGHSNIWSREQEASAYSSLAMAGSCKPHAHAHASDDEHQFQKHQLPLSMITPSHSSMTMLPRPPPPPHFASSNSHLRLINYAPPPPPPPYNTTSNNMFLNKLQQKEGTLYNQDTRQQIVCRKAEGFQNTLEFSSSKNNEEEHINMRGREGNELYEGDGADERDEEAASPTELMISNMPLNNNNMNSSSAAGGSQTPRKARRCWSPELHQRFLHALHQLGGPQSATPKQIREVMHVEGLTNDEVKSHLQKFRLHNRRPAPIQSSEPAQQPHHLVLFGGIWVPTSPAESAPAAQLTACHLAGGGHATSSGNHNAYVPFQHVIGQNPMQALMRAASSDQLDVHGGLETASEVDVARSDQSTSQNGGLENNVHEDEDTEIHLGSKPIISREITSPIAKARYQ